jgi:hypothetical protein
MSDINNIDDLFKAKLAGREVGYSASAWAKASALLDSHFRLLFLKKLFLFGIPFLLIITSAVLYWTNENPDIRTAGQETASTEIGVAASKSSVVTDLTITTASTVPTADQYELTEQIYSPSEIADARVNAQINALSSNKDATANLDELASTDTQISIKSTANKAQKIVTTKTTSEFEPEMASSIADNKDEVNVVTQQSTYSANDNVGSEMMSTDMAALILNSDLDLMDIMLINGNRSEISELGPSLKPESVNLTPKKLQLFAEGGLLMARGFHDLNVERLGPGFGFHARILGKYHIGQSVYLDFGAGILNRGSVTKNKDFTGMQPGSLIEISPIAANYASILIGTGYRIGLRHSIGGGFELNPFINLVAKEEVTINGEVSKSAYITEKTGMAGLDAAFVLNHRMAIKERLDVCTELHLGIFDATDNAVFSTGDVNDYNTAIKVGVSYRLTKR